MYGSLKHKPRKGVENGKSSHFNPEKMRNISTFSK